MKPVSPDSTIYVEIGQSSLKALVGEEGLELPLEPQSNGRLTSASRESLGHKLNDFLSQKIVEFMAKAFPARRREPSIRLRLQGQLQTFFANQRFQRALADFDVDSTIGGNGFHWVLEIILPIR